jgi:hypothetical protein
MTRERLQEVRAWADGKLATGQEPPWAWYQYIKLRETLDAILAGQDAATTESSPQSEQRPERHLRVVASTCPQDASQHRPADPTVQMPM